MLAPGANCAYVGVEKIQILDTPRPAQDPSSLLLAVSRTKTVELVLGLAVLRFSPSAKQVAVASSAPHSANFTQVGFL